MARARATKGKKGKGKPPQKKARTQLDDTDKRILLYWLRNPGTSKTKIAKAVGLAKPTVLERMKAGKPLRNAIDTYMESLIEDAADRLAAATPDAADVLHNSVKGFIPGNGRAKGVTVEVRDRIRAAEAIFDQVSPSKNAPPVPEQWVVFVGEGGIVKQKKLRAGDVGQLPEGEDAIDVEFEELEE